MPSPPIAVRDRELRIAAGSLLALIFVVNVYRAATQSITHDEAYTYLLFVSGTWSEVFSVYTANHHILHTFLVKLSIDTFGLSELTMRIPSLLGGLLYLASSYRLVGVLFDRPAARFLALALLTLNPFVLDFLVAARGYGLALGFGLWSLYHLLCALRDQYRPVAGANASLLKASIGAGLSVSANLAFLPASLAMLGSFGLMILLFDLRRPLAGARQTLARLVLYLVLPGLISFTLICAGPLRTATVGHFWAGAESPLETIRGLVAHAIRHSPPAWESPALLDAWVTLMEALVMVAPVFLLAAAVSLWIRSLRRGGFAHVEPRLASLVLLLTTLAGALLALALAHELVGVRYPQARAALYLVPLSVLCGVLLIERADARPKLRAPARLAYALAVLVAVQFALQLNVAHFALFRYDAGTKRIFSLILGLDPPRPGVQLRLGVDWLFAPSINFHRRMYDTRWIAPVTRAGPSGDEDYFVLLAEGYESFIAERRLEVLYTDPISGAILAARPPLAAELPPAGSPRAGEEGDVGR